MKMRENTTIAAISTGLSPAGIAIIRVSGPEAVPVVDALFRGRKTLSKAKSHTIHHGVLMNGGTIVDEVLVSVLKAPNTYTGEDVVEINCHGGIRVAKEVLSAVTGRGAVLAEPGEFTKRAFLNGRMDLSRAEAVIDVIEAENAFALKAGLDGLSGRIREEIQKIRQEILDETAFIEAALDDPEHYELSGYGQELLPKLTALSSRLDTLILRSERGSILKEGIRTVIAGKPNAGKSSLLNALSGREKAIVTDVPGTTRDVLEEPVDIGGISLILMDTAGLRETEDAVERIGVDRAKAAADRADLILYVVDAAAGLRNEDQAFLKAHEGTRTIVLYNKADLLALDRRTELPENALYLSCRTGEGFEVLNERINALFYAGALCMNDQVVITNARQKALLKEAAEAVEKAEESVKCGLSEEFVSADLTAAYASLGEILGEAVSDDVIDRVFEKFCMGK